MQRRRRVESRSVRTASTAPAARHRDRRRRRRLDGRRLVGLAVLVVALVGGGVTVLQGREATAPAPAKRVLVTQVSPTSLTVRWNAVGTASAYDVKVATRPSMEDARTVRFTSPEGVLSGLKQDTRYWVRVDPIGEKKGEADVRAVSARTEPVGVPTFEGDPEVGPESVGLAWSAVDGAEAYVVEHATKDDFADPDRTVVDEPKAKVEKLRSNRTYWFRVAVADPETQEPLGPWVAEPAEATTTDLGVKVGTFNVYGVHNDKREPAERDWRARRPVVVQQIQDSDLDVVGVQEVSSVSSGLYRRNLVDGATQYLDLRNGLRAGGDDWQLTDENRATSNDTRILYRGDRLKVVEQGGLRYRAQVNENNRYLAWAVLEVKETGNRFLFVTTHLTPKSPGVRERQWRELIGLVQAKAGDLPVVIGGDFNASKSKQPGGRMLSVMENLGIAEILGQRAGDTSAARARAEKVVRGDFYSFHDFDRTPRSQGQGRIGYSVDYLFATTSLKVRQWELVGNFDGAGRLVGTLPSDHFLLTAEIEIP